MFSKRPLFGAMSAYLIIIVSAAAADRSTNLYAPSLAQELSSVGDRVALRVRWSEAHQEVVRAERGNLVVGTGAANFRAPIWSGTLHTKLDLNDWTSCAGLAGQNQLEAYDYGDRSSFGAGEIGYNGTLSALTVKASCGLFMGTSGGRLGVIGGVEVGRYHQESAYASRLTAGTVDEFTQRDESGIAVGGSMGVTYHNHYYNAGGYLVARTALNGKLSGESVVTNIAGAQPTSSQTFASDNERTLRPFQTELGISGQVSERLRITGIGQISFWDAADRSVVVPATTVPADDDPHALAQPNQRTYALTALADYRANDRFTLGVGLSLRSDASEGFSDAVVLPDTPEAELGARVRMSIADGLSLSIEASAARSLSKEQPLANDVRVGWGPQQRGSLAVSLGWGY